MPARTSKDACTSLPTDAAGEELDTPDLKGNSAPKWLKDPARLAGLPAHLRLGITVVGIRAHLEGLPADAVEQVNSSIAKNADGTRKFPLNITLNGYVNQNFITKESEKDQLSVCERLQRQGSPEAGPADVFVSWFLATPIATLIDALEVFLQQHSLPAHTYFWVCDFSIHQTDVKSDLRWLGDCVGSVGHTVLLLEPWHAPQPLQRAYCVKEVYHTQKSGARFDVVMSSAQQEAFEWALVNDFDSITRAVSEVDVQKAECRNKRDQEEILKVCIPLPSNTWEREPFPALRSAARSSLAPLASLSLHLSS